MRLAERGQRRAHDQVLEMHPQVPRPVREGGGEDGDGQMGEATGSEKGGMGEEAGVKGRKRTIKGLAEVRMEGGAEGEEEGDDDEAFLRKYCGVRAL